MFQKWYLRPPYISNLNPFTASDSGKGASNRGFRIKRQFSDGTAWWKMMRFRFCERELKTKTIKWHFQGNLTMPSWWTLAWKSKLLPKIPTFSGRTFFTHCSCQEICRLPSIFLLLMTPTTSVPSIRRWKTWFCTFKWPLHNYLLESPLLWATCSFVRPLCGLACLLTTWYADCTHILAYHMVRLY